MLAKPTVLAAAVTALALLPAASAHPSFTRVTLDGVAGVRPGMSERAVEARWGVSLRLQGTRGSPCAAARLVARGVDGYAIFLRGRFDSVYFRRGASTPSGIRIGSTLAELRRAYGRRLTSRLDAYVRGARNYFLRRVQRPRWELRFDVSPRRCVTQIAFGGESVRYTEGCA